MTGKGAVRWWGVAVLGAACALAQETALPNTAIKISLPADSPVSILSLDSSNSRFAPRGAAILVDLDLSLTLRNTGTNRIHGVSLRVVSQESSVGGKAWVCLPRLNIGPGESFPVHIAQKLMRPTAAASGPMVEVSLDGVLFQDLSFVGPDKLHSRRDMVAWEMEAQRDRKYFRQVLTQNGAKGLRDAILQEMARMQERPQLDVRVMRRGAAATSAATATPEHTERFAFLRFPDSPVEVVDGSAVVAGDEERTPHIQVRGRSAVAVRYVEIGWLVQDQSGKQFLAAEVPSAQADLNLTSGKTAEVTQDSVLRVTRNGQPMNIQGMTGFVSQVEFADGKVWIPSRQNLDEAARRNVSLPPSAEVLRLMDLYRNKGIDALAAELNKQ